MSHVELLITASIVKVRLVSSESFRRLICFGEDVNESLADVEGIIPKWLQQRDVGIDRGLLILFSSGSGPIRESITYCLFVLLSSACPHGL